nr:MAG TPA: tail sheath protein [Caudoviricetes sp.]
MPIPANLKTPGTYLDVNINTQRTGLPANIHKVLFITNDVQQVDGENPLMPVSIYDKAQAEQIFGGEIPSEAGRMITAAIKTNRVVDVQILGKLQAEV